MLLLRIRTLRLFVELMVLCKKALWVMLDTPANTRLPEGG
jgi:hypothetical protein